MEIFQDIQSCLSDDFRHQDVNFQIFISYVLQLPGRNVFLANSSRNFLSKIKLCTQYLETYTAKTI